MATADDRLSDDPTQEQITTESRATIDFLLASPSFRELLTTMVARRVRSSIDGGKSFRRKQERRRRISEKFGGSKSEPYQGALEDHPQYSASVCLLGMTLQTTTALMNELGNDVTVGQLARSPEERICRSRNIGEVRIAEIRAALHTVGLDLDWVDTANTPAVTSNEVDEVEGEQND